MKRVPSKRKRPHNYAMGWLKKIKKKPPAPSIPLRKGMRVRDRYIRSLQGRVVEVGVEVSEVLWDEFGRSQCVGNDYLEPILDK